MAWTKTERELFEEKFTGLGKLINAQFEAQADCINRIEAQTLKTNGRVTDLEHKELTHFQTCPQIEPIRKINEDLAEYRMVKKYPKIAVVILSIAVIVLLASLRITEKTNKVIKEIQSIEQWNKNSETSSPSGQIASYPELYDILQKGNTPMQQ
jgi:hypothetical protein